MVPKGYKEVSEGIYESDAFITSRPKIDSARVRQILNEQPSSMTTDCSNTHISPCEQEHAAQESSQHTGV